MHVVLYSKDNCSQCNTAKTILGTKGIVYEEKKLGEDFTREHLMEMFPSARSFPVVVVDGFNIGGVSDLTKMLNEQSQSGDQKFLSEGNWNGN